MPFQETNIDGVLIFEPRVFQDKRGYFFEAFNEEVFSEAGINKKFVQDNQSRSIYGVIRGLHYQLNPNAQSKLIRVLEGSVLDVIVDIRRNSPTFGQHYSIELSAENHKQLFIPAGFAHGFSVLSETATVIYKCDTLYKKESEAGIIYNDPSLNIDWQIPKGKEIISEKDILLPSFADSKNNFEY